MNIVHVAQKLDIIEIDQETGKRNIYFSRVEDVSENYMLIQAPFRKGFYLPPKINRTITAKVITNNCPYLFEAKLKGTRTEPVLLWEISSPVNIKKIQMRDFVRIDILLDVKIELLHEPHKGKIISTLTKNISGGGLLIVLNEVLPVESKVKIILPLNQVTIEAQGQVVRCAPFEKTKDRFTLGIKFTDIEEKTRREIIRYVFAKQVETRQKEKSLWTISETFRDTP